MRRDPKKRERHRRHGLALKERAKRVAAILQR
jgi:hypothetical protein